MIATATTTAWTNILVGDPFSGADVVIQNAEKFTGNNFSEVLLVSTSTSAPAQADDGLSFAPLVADKYTAPTHLWVRSAGSSNIKVFAESR